MKNLPIALIFLPAADIPTFVGEGRVDLGITGWDQVQEHDAGVRTLTRARRASGEFTPEDLNGKPQGCETVMDLGFGACKLQVQVPEKGSYTEPKDLIGKNICTSFVHLAHEYFERLELEQAAAAATNGDDDANFSPKKLRTKIIELSGSVEAACALGVADGIVDLVGTYHSRELPFLSRERERERERERKNGVCKKSIQEADYRFCRIRRDDEGSGPQAH